MAGNHHQYSDSYDDNVDFPGTEPRPTGPGHLHEVWREGEAEEVDNKAGEGVNGAGSYSPLHPPVLEATRNAELQ